ncbi:ParB/RepB/Spo0J family partition protein [bacterium]|nr:ParB/RepB/Spo0J family partition protein [bacterium]MBU1753246.1 ParB/RepB/Spo0J family partition protein [bacterium]
MQRIALGKGLDALIPEARSGGEAIREIKIGEIVPGEYQPRRCFDPEKQRELVESIMEKGVIQPIIVRPSKDGYELVAGERRLRAAHEAGLERIPAIVREMSNEDALEIGLIENIQRQDLNPMEEAEAFQQLIREFHLTQDSLAKKVGKDRSSVTNSLRLLKLPKPIQEEVSKGTISMGHARAILSLNNETEQQEVCGKIVKNGISVRETEALVKKMQENVSRETSKTEEEKPIDIALESCTEKLMQSLGTKVRISRTAKGTGKIEIEFYSQEDLDRIIEKVV